jgi:hypothetical protein
MSDSETRDVVELQTRLSEKLRTLGFSDEPHASEVAHHLAEIVARGRTLDQQALPLFLSLQEEHRRSMAELTVAIKVHLDAIQDSITDVQEAWRALTDFLLRETE